MEGKSNSERVRVKDLFSLLSEQNDCAQSCKCVGGVCCDEDRLKRREPVEARSVGGGLMRSREADRAESPEERSSNVVRFKVISKSDLVYIFES